MNGFLDLTGFPPAARYRGLGLYAEGLARKRGEEAEKRRLARLYLEQNPYAQYRSFLPQLDTSMRRYYEPRFGDIYGEYQGELARQAQSGELPKLSFGAFLGNYNFPGRFSALPPEQRGYGRTSRLRPRMRFLNF